MHISFCLSADTVSNIHIRNILNDAPNINVLLDINFATIIRKLRQAISSNAMSYEQPIVSESKM